MKPVASGLQYVVLYHTGFGDPHFDIMLEVSRTDPLMTFRSELWPIHGRLQLTPLGEHRREYLRYEGPVGGGRGEVRRVTSGTYDLSGDGTNIIVRFTSGTDHEPLVITDEAEAMPLRLFEGA
jgi:hypothetical protein